MRILNLICISLALFAIIVQMYFSLQASGKPVYKLEENVKRKINLGQSP